STIGVGQSIDFDLLRSLAENGRGSNHFIGDSEQDIQKVFINEVESLLYNLGNEPEISIELPKGFNILKVYGYSPVLLSENKIKVGLENLNAGTTRVILLEVEKDKSAYSRISAQLEYKIDGQLIRQKETIKYLTNHRKLTNDEILKNYSIALMADALKDYSKEFTKGSPTAKNQIDMALAFTKAKADMKDEDILRIYNLLTAL